MNYRNSCDRWLLLVCCYHPKTQTQQQHNTRTMVWKSPPKDKVFVVVSIALFGAFFMASQLFVPAILTSIVQYSLMCSTLLFVHAYLTIISITITQLIHDNNLHDTSSECTLSKPYITTTINRRHNLPYSLTYITILLFFDPLRHDHPSYVPNEVDAKASRYKSFIDGGSAFVNLFALPMLGIIFPFFLFTSFFCCCFLLLANICQRQSIWFVWKETDYGLYCLCSKYAIHQ